MNSTGQPSRDSAPSYVVAWPPKGLSWPSDEFTQFAGGTARFACPWTSKFDAKKGTRVYLAQSEAFGRGIFASGIAERDSRKQAKFASALDVAWDVILDPRLRSNLLDPSAQIFELQSIAPEIELVHEAGTRLEQLWSAHVARLNHFISERQEPSSSSGETRDVDLDPDPDQGESEAEDDVLRRGATKIATPGQLRGVIKSLSVSHPMTDRFSARWRGSRGSKNVQQEQKQPWYTTQHEHWLGWLGGYDGPGGYEREDWDRTAEFVYNHIVNPQMLIYLSEATAIDRALVETAVDAALDKTTMMGMSGAIRRILPWSMVEGALLATI